MTKFNQVPLSELKAILPHCKRQIQHGMRRLATSKNGENVAFLVPLSDLKRIEESEQVGAIPEMSISEFRADIEGALKFFNAGGCCTYITMNTRRAFLLVAGSLGHCLPVPVSEVGGKLALMQAGGTGIVELH